MNLEELRAKIINKVEPFDWLGESVYLRKVGAADGIALFTKIKALSTGELAPGDDQALTLEYHALLASKSLADERGNLVLDTDEGRQALKQVNFNDLVALGDMILKHSGFQRDEKKSSPTLNSLDSDSANSSDSGLTPTTSTLS